ncbi:MAG: nicotinate-nicotinamide nucleotide adenylyltransferase [Myxococcota bacterium]|nr:nicotinate-nicotinamide nucleotide adenylyltransferase [Myxococcota bacterium]
MSDSFSEEWGRINDLSEVAEKYGQAGKYRLAMYRLHNAKIRASDLSSRSLERQQISTLRKFVESIPERLQYFADENKKVELNAGEVKNRPHTVALFGLSANPPTGKGGHAGIVDWCAGSMTVDSPNDTNPEEAVEGLPVDEVWVLPVYRHAFSEKSTLLSFEHRVAMAKLCFESPAENTVKVQVRELERELFLREQELSNISSPKKSASRLGSVDLVRMLQADFPHYQFAFVMGGDTYQDFRLGKWKGGFSLQELLPIVVCARHGVELDVHPLVERLNLQDVSSTKVRSSSDLAYLSACLEPPVLEYIREHKLYAFAHS